VRRQGLEPRTRGLRVRCPGVCRGSGWFWPGDTDCPGAPRTLVNCNQNCNCPCRAGGAARPEQDCPWGSRWPGAALRDAGSARRVAADIAAACAPSPTWPVHSAERRPHTRRTGCPPVRQSAMARECARTPLRDGIQRMRAPTGASRGCCPCIRRTKRRANDDR
jgi:hypothetical protein